MTARPWSKTHSTTGAVFANLHEFSSAARYTTSNMPAKSRFTRLGCWFCKLHHCLGLNSGRVTRGGLICKIPATFSKLGCLHELCLSDAAVSGSTMMQRIISQRFRKRAGQVAVSRQTWVRATKPIWRNEHTLASKFYLHSLSPVETTSSCSLPHNLSCLVPSTDAAKRLFPRYFISAWCT